MCFPVEAREVRNVSLLRHMRCLMCFHAKAHEVRNVFPC